MGSRTRSHVGAAQMGATRTREELLQICDHAVALLQLQLELVVLQEGLHRSRERKRHGRPELGCDDAEHSGEGGAHEHEGLRDVQAPRILAGFSLCEDCERKCASHAGG